MSTLLQEKFWEPPWHHVRAEESERLHAQLLRELGRGHQLFEWRGKCHAIAARQDRDDVLFALADKRVVQVHLTWSKTVQPPPFPRSEFFSSLDTFAQSLNYRSAVEAFSRS